MPVRSSRPAPLMALDSLRPVEALVWLHLRPAVLAVAVSAVDLAADSVPRPANLLLGLKAAACRQQALLRELTTRPMAPRRQTRPRWLPGLLTSSSRAKSLRWPRRARCACEERADARCALILFVALPFHSLPPVTPARFRQLAERAAQPLSRIVSRSLGSLTTRARSRQTRPKIQRHDAIEPRAFGSSLFFLGPIQYSHERRHNRLHAAHARPFRTPFENARYGQFARHRPNRAGFACRSYDAGPRARAP